MSGRGWGGVPFQAARDSNETRGGGSMPSIYDIVRLLAQPLLVPRWMLYLAIVNMFLAYYVARHY